MLTKETTISYMMLAEIMLIFAFVFLLLVTTNSSSEETNLILKPSTLDEVFKNTQFEKTELPKVWNEITFVNTINSLIKENKTIKLKLDLEKKENQKEKKELGKQKRESDKIKEKLASFQKNNEELKTELKLEQKENQKGKKELGKQKTESDRIKEKLALVQKNNEKLKTQKVKLDKGKKFLSDVLKKVFPKTHEKELSGILRGNPAVKQKVEMKFQGFGRPSCWVKNKDIANYELNTGRIEVPLRIEIYENYYIVRKNWDKKRNDDAKLFEFEKYINKKLTEGEFKQFGSSVIKKFRQAGYGTDWQELGMQCRFYFQPVMFLDSSIKLGLAEKYFLKLKPINKF